MNKDIVKFSYDGLNFEGISEGGIRTSIVCSSLNLMFDIGHFPVDSINIDKVFLTHGHLDHAAGIPYYISQRSLRNLKAPSIYIPAYMEDTLREILNLYQKIEDFEYKYNLFPVELDKHYTINSFHTFKALKTHHRIPSQGYTIFEKSKKLLPQFANLSGKEIANLKEQSVNLTEDKFKPIVSFSGDTKIEYVLENSDVKHSKILFLECTYLDDKRNTERARTWGHLHLDEIVTHAKEFQNEKLVLIHFSKRYRPKEIKEFVYSKLPSDLKERTMCFIT